MLAAQDSAGSCFFKCLEACSARSVAHSDNKISAQYNQASWIADNAMDHCLMAS